MNHGETVVNCSIRPTLNPTSCLTYVHKVFLRMMQCLSLPQTHRHILWIFLNCWSLSHNSNFLAAVFLDLHSLTFSQCSADGTFHRNPVVHALVWFVLWFIHRRAMRQRNACVKCLLMWTVALILPADIFPLGFPDPNCDGTVIPHHHTNTQWAKLAYKNILKMHFMFGTRIKSPKWEFQQLCHSSFINYLKEMGNGSETLAFVCNGSNSCSLHTRGSIGQEAQRFRGIYLSSYGTSGKKLSICICLTKKRLFNQ